MRKAILIIAAAALLTSGAYFFIQRDQPSSAPRLPWAEAKAKVLIISIEPRDDYGFKGQIKIKKVLTYDPGDILFGYPNPLIEDQTINVVRIFVSGEKTGNNRGTLLTSSTLSRDKEMEKQYYQSLERKKVFAGLIYCKENQEVGIGCSYGNGWTMFIQEKKDFGIRFFLDTPWKY